MIRRDEIDEKARQFEILPANVERDYVFGWLLFGLFTASPLRDKLFLKGGNALRKGYFEHTRFSGDLDFGMHGDIPEAVLLAEINNVCDFIHEKAGVDFVKDANVIKEKFVATDAPLPNLKVYEVRVYFKDFYGKPGHVKVRISMDITRFDKVLLPIQSRPLIHPYSDAAELNCEIRCMKLEEIIATKLKCLMQRQHAPDLFDYVYSIKLLGGSLNRDEVVRALIQKTIFSRNSYWTAMRGVSGTLRCFVLSIPVAPYRVIAWHPHAGSAPAHPLIANILHFNYITSCNMLPLPMARCRLDHAPRQHK
jgi:predicted nucleotidyltransferase component of viral defense system